MNTTLTIKTEKRLWGDAQRTARELGIPLTTVVNALLRQFVRERILTLSVEPKPTAEKMALWESISKEADKGKSIKTFSNVEGLLKDLRLV